MSKFSISLIRIVAKKEIIEFIRDWRTIVALILIPLFLFPLLFIAFPLVMENEAQELQELEVDILVQSDYIDGDILEGLNQSNMSIDIEPLPIGLQTLSEPLNDSSRLPGLHLFHRFKHVQLQDLDIYKSIMFAKMLRDWFLNYFMSLM